MSISAPNINAYDQGEAQQPISYELVQVEVAGVRYTGCLVKVNPETNIGWCMVERDSCFYEVFPCSLYTTLGANFWDSLAPVPSATTKNLEEALRFALEAASV